MYKIYYCIKLKKIYKKQNNVLVNYNNSWFRFISNYYFDVIVEC